MLLLLTILDGNTFAAGVNRSDPVPPTRSTEAYHTGCLHSFCARLSGSHVSSPLHVHFQNGVSHTQKLLFTENRHVIQSKI
jgi:hypothetical protein